MGPKRTFRETLFESSGSDSSSSSSDAPASGDEDQEYLYQTLETDPATGRAVYTSSIVSAFVPASPSKRAPAPTYPPSRTDAQGTWIYDFMDNDWAFAEEGAGLEDEGEATPPPSESSSDGETEPAPKKRTRSEPYRPIKKWKKKYRPLWLDELLWSWCRGRSMSGTRCIGYSDGTRARGVSSAFLSSSSGFASFWAANCTLFAPGKTFLVIDCKGLHEVDLWYCDCGKGASFPVQLLRIRWLPSTGKQPRTAATFNVMRQYHLFSLESKCSMREFYNGLVRQTNNTGTPPPNHYQEFINMTRIWRNLQMFKRAGCAHQTDGIDTAKPGACAVECPACPHPGKNLPPDWKDVPPEKRFLYAMFLALDANFRMQRKDVSSKSADPDLGNGMAFFGEVNGYMAHLEKHWDQKQPKSMCVAHDAVNTPDKEVRGTASSGIGTVDCARHNMKRPRGVGDLQAGERYLNMDYMFFKSLEGSELQEFFIYPRAICKENEKRFFVFLVPKFHLPAHIESCNINFSFLLTRYVAQTDGEAPERGWSNINPLALSTREMGPHLRRPLQGLELAEDTEDGIRDYIPAMVETQGNTLEQEQTLPKAALAEWTVATVAWEEDTSKPNPFARMTQEVSMASVRYELAVEGGGAVRGDTESAEMLAQGVQLEEAQRELKFDQAAAGLHPTLAQKRVMLERCGKTRHKLLLWMDTQMLFMPEVVVLRTAAADACTKASQLKPVAGELVQDIPLLLPSALEAHVACMRELQEYEFRLREGQAHEALHEMRHHLLVRTHKYKYKDANVQGVREFMRTNTKIEAINDHIERAKAMYRVAREALAVLGPRLEKVGWDKHLQVLRDEDVRQMPEGTFRKPGREGKRKRRKESAPARKKRRREAARPISWIWLADGSAADADRNPAMNEALRIEWARTRALGLRNTKEVDLLEEEMCRTPVHLCWRADWWEG
ncbi:hypothetical protein DFH09DRAFT_1305749 [Mycena vulgaris]|nr:hypothetical protein DFH09DRAFT_1305749 [Mycena vulgaris]